MNILIHTISGIETTIQICNYLSHSAHTTIQSFIKNSDVMDKLQNTQSILYQIRHHDGAILEDPCHPVVVATHSMIDIVKLIRADLSEINTITTEHQQKWIRYFYSPDYVALCKRLETHICIHDLRVRRLMHVIPTFLDKSYETRSSISTPTPKPTTTMRRHSWS